MPAWEPEFNRTLIMSDMHFGIKDTSLAETAVIDRLMAALAQLGPFDHLVLLGDVWDLWQAHPMEAYAKSEQFMRSICRLHGLVRISFLPGNHDHPAYRWHLEEGWYEEGSGGKPWPFRLGVESALLKALNLPPTIELKLLYPDFAMRSHGRTVLLTHGHHMDYFSKHWYGTTSVLARLINWFLHRPRPRDLGEVEDNNLPLFELVASFAYTRDLKHFPEKFYALLKKIASLFGMGTDLTGKNRGADIESCLNGLRGYLKLAGATWSDPIYKDGPDIYIYGHTHFGEIAEKDFSGWRGWLGKRRQVIVANAGSWITSEKQDTFLVLEGGRIGLFHLDGDIPPEWFPK